MSRKFEYLFRTVRAPVGVIDETFTKRLNELGKEGWELCHMSEGVMTAVRGGQTTQDRSFVVRREIAGKGKKK